MVFRFGSVVRLCLDWCCEYHVCVLHGTEFLPHFVIHSCSHICVRTCTRTHDAACTQALALGFPPEKLYTHLGGTFIPTRGSYPTIPFSSGKTAGANLGVSIYKEPPEDSPGLLAELKKEGAVVQFRVFSWLRCVACEPIECMYVRIF